MDRDAYDYVVVGAGTAGCVLAARLSEDPGCRVLLLEAGPAATPPDTRDPATWTRRLGGELDWAYLTPPERGLHGRSVSEPHGRTVGGTSSLNAMLYQRGQPRDFDSWAYRGAPGWGHEALLPYFHRVERRSDDEAGSGGVLPLVDAGSRMPHPVAEAFLRTCEAAGHRRLSGFDEAPRPELGGAGYFHVNIADGARVGAAEAYLEPARSRPNLTVLGAAEATRVLLAQGRCVGVEYLHGGHAHQVAASAEVILAASAAESPKLLMLSGIGEPAELARHGIDVVVDLPGVGRNLHDHVFCPLTLPLLRAAPRAELAFAAALFLASDEGWLGPDLEIVFGATTFDQVDDAPPRGITLLPALIRPMSRGRVRLAGADPRLAPVVDPDLLGVPDDARRLATAVIRARELAATAPLSSWLGAESTADAVPFDDPADGIDFVRGHAASQWHLAGSCRMGLDELAVVDPQLRVHGVDGLRVVDVSIMPAVVSGHCQAAVLAIAERAADLMTAGRPVVGPA